MNVFRYCKQCYQSTIMLSIARPRYTGMKKSFASAGPCADPAPQEMLVVHLHATDAHSTGESPRLTGMLPAAEAPLSHRIKGQLRKTLIPAPALRCWTSSWVESEGIKLQRGERVPTQTMLPGLRHIGLDLVNESASLAKL